MLNPIPKRLLHRKSSHESLESDTGNKFPEPENIKESVDLGTIHDISSGTENMPLEEKHVVKDTRSLRIKLEAMNKFHEASTNKKT